jgi:hemerythrin-like domain-containing protein
MSFKQVLSGQHRACDQELVKIEQAAHKADWAGARQAAKVFIEDTEAHFRFEEQVLFPALESATPMAAGPTSVMRSEHSQMRDLFGELQDASEKRDASQLADAVETLLLLMQQHNMKEENVLYPIADQSLSDNLLSQLQGSGEAG